MIVTEEQARHKMCPRSMGNTILSPCRASDCMAWRWSDREPAKPLRTTYWPATEDAAELRSETEPSREGATEGGDLVTVPATGVEWVPMEGEGDDCDGGFWEDTEEGVEARYREAVANRRGYCGLAPVVQS